MKGAWWRLAYFQVVVFDALEIGRWVMRDAEFLCEKRTRSGHFSDSDGDDGHPKQG